MTHPAEIDDMPSPGDLLFAYGTLQRGGQYHYFLERCGARFVSKGKTQLPYPLILADYPCLLDRPGEGTQVEGEVFEIPNSPDWEAIDRLEDHPREYRRRLEPIQTGSQTVQAWTYFFQT
jgi:gamma-glutamylcyclotransferase (GGCT)/AIG2-like uncharacterized protein YtfP